MSEKSKPEGADDLFPGLGNMASVTVKHLQQVLSQDNPQVMENYETLTEDFIECFNHAVMQSVPPEWCLFAFSQAFSITLAACIRSNLDAKEAGKLIALIVRNTDAASKMLKEVTVQ